MTYYSVSRPLSNFFGIFLIAKAASSLFMANSSNTNYANSILSTITCFSVALSVIMFRSFTVRLFSFLSRSSMSRSSCRDVGYLGKKSFNLWYSRYHAFISNSTSLLTKSAGSNQPPTRGFELFYSRLIN